MTMTLLMVFEVCLQSEPRNDIYTGLSAILRLRIPSVMQDLSTGRLFIMLHLSGTA